MSHRSTKINAFFSAFVLLLLSFAGAQAQVHTPHYGTAISTNTNGFYDYLPQGYSASGTTLYPLIIQIHGMGEYGDGSKSALWKAIKHGVPHEINVNTFPTSFTLAGKTYKFIVLTPQWRRQATAGDVNGAIDYALSHYKVDPKRVYITGLSAGGGVVENVAADPTVGKRIAAVVEFCGTSDPSITRATNIINNGVAFWGIHNSGDNIVPASKTIGWVGTILSVKATAYARKTIPVGTDHNCWTGRYKASWTEGGLSIYQWMLQFARGTVTTTNAAPVANAGTDKTVALPTSSVSLSGSATDGDGTISKYAWTKTAGPNTPTFSSTTSATTTISGLIAGTYTFRLTVTDNKGATDYDDVNVVVSTSNVAPKANAGSDKIITLPTSSLALAGSGTDADGTISKYAWTKTAGPSAYTFSSTSVANPTVSGLTAGTYTFRLTVTDNKGATGYDDVNVVVNAAATTYAVPGKVEAENYAGMYGVQKETTSDAGGGQDVGYIDQNDWIDYSIKTTASGKFSVTFRVASGTTTGSQFQVRNSSGTVLATVTVPATGGFQVWKDVTASISLASGTQTIRLYSANAARWNINYLNFATGTVTSTTTGTKVEAENYSSMGGVTKETTSDASGGYDITSIDSTDWMEYNISPTAAGSYTLKFRLASAVTGGKFDVLNAAGTRLASVSVPNTGGVQSWTDVSATVQLAAGAQTIMLYSTAKPKWSINYFTYSVSGTTTAIALANTATAAVVSEESGTKATSMSVSPNPFRDRFVLQVNTPNTGTMKVNLVDLNGVVRKSFQVAKNTAGSMQTYLSAGTLAAGTYFVKTELGSWTQTTKLVKL